MFELSFRSAEAITYPKGTVIRTMPAWTSLFGSNISNKPRYVSVRPPVDRALLTMSSSSVNSVQLTAFVEFVSSSFKDIIGAYDAVGHDALSLDSLTEGPFDTPAITPVNVPDVRQIIEAVCTQLCATCATVAHPDDCVVNIRNMHFCATSDH